MRFEITTLLALASVPLASAKKGCATKPGWETSYTATGTADVAAAAATAKTSSPTSHVKGEAFDRIVFIWFENENFDLAAGDRKSSYLCFTQSSERDTQLTFR
jgi:acid phosphatase